WREWLEDRAPRLAAALAFYSVFSIGPLILLAIGAASLILGQEAAQGTIAEEIRGTVGDHVAQTLQQTLLQGHQSAWGPGATILGVVTLVFGALGVLNQLQDGLNTIWKVVPKPDRGVLDMIRDRLLSFTMVLGTGFLVLASLVITAGLAAAGTSPGWAVPGVVAFWQVVHQCAA